MQMGVGIRQSVADVDTDSLLSQNWPPSPPVHWRSCSETDSATTEKHGRKKTEKTARNATEFLISVDLGKVWPPLVSSAWAGRGVAIRWVRVCQRGALRWGGYQMGRLPDSGRSAFNAIASTLVGAGFG